MTINGQHLISQVIALCGGSNVFTDRFFILLDLSRRHSPRILQGVDRLCEALAKVRSETP